jgi:hypothetical protein
MGLSQRHVENLVNTVHPEHRLLERVTSVCHRRGDPEEEVRFAATASVLRLLDIAEAKANKRPISALAIHPTVVACPQAAGCPRVAHFVAAGRTEYLVTAAWCRSFPHNVPLAP